MAWDPTKYQQFSAQRFRPALDLIARIPDMAFDAIIDLGCGSGEITKLLQQTYQPTHLVAIDNSETMLARASEQYPDMRWELAEIDNVGASYDLIFSNAALQWVDGHKSLLPRLAQQATKVLAIQMPDNFHEPSHVLLRETIQETPYFYEKLAPTLRQEPVLPAPAYFDLLHPYASQLDIWQTRYLHALQGKDAVLEWVKGTALVPIRARLEAGAYVDFLERYREKLASVYPMRSDGVTLFSFPRLLMVLVKEGKT